MKDILFFIALALASVFGLALGLFFNSFLVYLLWMGLEAILIAKVYVL